MSSAGNPRQSWVVRACIAGFFSSVPLCLVVAWASGVHSSDSLLVLALALAAVAAPLGAWGACSLTRRPPEAEEPQ